MKLKTDLLKEMITKVIQGASNNKLLPITSLLGINCSNNTLTLISTDGNNRFLVMCPIDYNQEYFYSVVNAETFSKLVAKTTTEYIEIENKENYLEVRANGISKFEMALNEDGQIVKFPEVFIEGSSETINLNELKTAIKTAQASVAKTMEIPFLTGYYISDKIITTDRQMVCKLDKQLVTEPILITNETAKLLLLLDDSEEVVLYRNQNNLVFKTPKYIIGTKELEGKLDYSNNIVKAIDNLTSLNYDSVVKLDKADLLNTLDRMTLFVTDYDKNGVYLMFKEDGLEIQSQHSNAQEELPVKEIINPAQFTCLIDIEMLKQQIQSLLTDTVEIHYGQQKSIELIEGNTTLVIALLENN